MERPRVKDRMKISLLERELAAAKQRAASAESLADHHAVELLRNESAYFDGMPASEGGSDWREILFDPEALAEELDYLVSRGLAERHSGPGVPRRDVFRFLPED